MQFPRHIAPSGPQQLQQTIKSCIPYDAKCFRDQDPASVLHLLIRTVDGLCQDKHKHLLATDQPNRGYQQTALPANPPSPATIVDLQEQAAFLLAAPQWTALSIEDRLLMLDALSVAAELVEPKLSANSKVRFADLEGFLELVIRVSETRKLLFAQLREMKLQKTFQAAARGATHTAAEKIGILDSLGIMSPLTSMIQVCVTVTRFIKQAGEDLSTRQHSKLKSLLDMCRLQYTSLVDLLDPRQDHATGIQSQREIFGLLGIPGNMHLHPGFVQILLLPGNQAVAGRPGKAAGIPGYAGQPTGPDTAISIEALSRREESPLNLVIQFLLSFLTAVDTVAPLGSLPSHHLEELITGLLVAKRYGSRNFELACKDLLTLLIKKVDNLLDYDEKDAQESVPTISNEEMEELVKKIKMLFNVLEPNTAGNPQDGPSPQCALTISRLECLWALKRGDLQKVLLYKQSLSGGNSSTSDFNFDLLIDLVRYCNHCQPSIELFVLLRKINSSAAKQWLQTYGVLESLKKVLCPKRATISKERDATGLVCFTLLCQSAFPQSLGSFFEALSETFLQLSQVEYQIPDKREQFHTSQISNETSNPFRGWVTEKANQLASHLDWQAAEELVTSLQVRVSALRACYLGFYFYKNINRLDHAQNYAIRLFRLSDGVQSLWKIARTNAELFLDIVEVITAETSTSNMDRESISQTTSIIQLLSEPCQDDPEDVSMYKALLRTKVYLSGGQSSRQPQEQAISDFAGVLKVLPLATVYSVLRNNLCEPVVYYPFFFALISHYLEAVQNSHMMNEQIGHQTAAIAAPMALFSLLMSVIEEQIEKLSANQYNYAKVRGYAPPLLKKALTLFEICPDCRELGLRASLHLYNMYLEDQDPEVLELAYIYGLKQLNPYAEVVAVYAIERVRNGKNFKKEEALGMLEWLESVKVRAKELEARKPEQTSHQMDEESFENELEALIQGEPSARAEPKQSEVGPKPTILSKEVICALDLSLKHAIDPQSAVSLISTLMLDSDPKIKSVVLFTASKLSRGAYSTALRGYLSYLTTQPSESKESLLEIYSMLLKTTDSTKELKTYFRLLEDLVRASGSQDKPFPLHGLANLTSELVLLQADFPSLSSELRQLSQSIKSTLDSWEHTLFRDSSPERQPNDRSLHMGTTAVLRLRSALETLLT